MTDSSTKTLDMAKTHDIAFQKDLFPIEALQIHKSTQGSADLQIIVTATNNKDYAVKTTQDGKGYVPATELFCYELAKLIDIPTPNFDLITMRDGSLAFGSMWEGGVHHISNANLIIDILSGKKKVRDLNQFLSRVYAFDLFINNIDRHFGNYLFRQSYNSLIGLAFDYSRAWYEVDAYQYNSLKDKSSNTQKSHNIISNYKKYDRNTASQTIKRISEIKTNKIELILRSIPDIWLSKEIKNDVANWWGSKLMQERILKIMGGL